MIHMSQELDHGQSWIQMDTLCFLIDWTPKQFLGSTVLVLLKLRLFGKEQCSLLFPNVSVYHHKIMTMSECEAWRYPMTPRPHFISFWTFVWDFPRVNDIKLWLMRQVRFNRSYRCTKTHYIIHEIIKKNTSEMLLGWDKWDSFKSFWKGTFSPKKSETNQGSA